MKFTEEKLEKAFAELLEQGEKTYRKLNYYWSGYLGLSIKVTF